MPSWPACRPPQRTRSTSRPRWTAARRASCCPPCCGCSADRGVLLAVILVTCGLLGYAAATVHLAPVVPVRAGQLTALPGPPGAAAADGSLRVASLRDATIIRIDPATGSVTARLPVTGAPTSLTMAGNRIWTTLRPATTSGQTAIHSATAEGGPPIRAARPAAGAGDVPGRAGRRDIRRRRVLDRPARPHPGAPPPPAPSAS
jgi:hypothetical protein